MLCTFPKGFWKQRVLQDALKKNLLNLNTQNFHLLLFISYLYNFISALYFVSKKVFAFLQQLYSKFCFSKLCFDL